MEVAINQTGSSVRVADRVQDVADYVEESDDEEKSDSDQMIYSKDDLSPDLPVQRQHEPVSDVTGRWMLNKLTQMVEEDEKPRRILSRSNKA